MKSIEFETSKGMFVVSDERYYLKNEFGIKTAYLNGVKQFEFEKFIEFSRITEEQASEIVSFEEEYNRSLYGSAKNKLHSLLKSKGIHLFENHNDKYCGTIEWQEAEQKTFYNPYIFKL